MQVLWLTCVWTRMHSELPGTVCSFMMQSAVTIDCRGALNHATAVRPLSVRRLIPQRHGYAPQQTLRGPPPPVWPGGLFRTGSRGQYLCTTWQGRKELHQPAPQREALWTELLKSGPPAWEAERDPRPVNPLSPAAFISSGETSITCPLPLDWLRLLIMPVHTHILGDILLEFAQHE